MAPGSVTSTKHPQHEVYPACCAGAVTPPNQARSAARARTGSAVTLPVKKWTRLICRKIVLPDGATSHQPIFHEIEPILD